MPIITIDTDGTDDRDLLLLIDYLADQLSSDISDDFPLLTEQFEAVDEYLPGSHRYPGPFSNTVNWRIWREYRDARIADKFGEK